MQDPKCFHCTLLRQIKEHAYALAQEEDITKQAAFEIVMIRGAAAFAQAILQRTDDKPRQRRMRRFFMEAFRVGITATENPHQIFTLDMSNIDIQEQ